MSEWNGWMASAVAAIVCGSSAVPVTDAAPLVSIGGLTGAEHWVWHEGEDEFSTPSGTAGTDVYRNNSGVSGWAPNGPDNAYERTTGSSNVRTVAWNIHTPAAMSSAAKIYARASINRTDVDMTITVGASVVAAEMVQSDQTNPTVFLEHKVGGTSVGQGVTVGPLAAGNHNVSYAAETYGVQGFSSFMVDGVLIYDGTAVLPTVADSGDRRWLLNPASADSPDLPDPVNPLLSVSGTTSGNVIQYLLNGESYTPGTEIGPGDYQLVVAVWESTPITSKRLAFAGANFSVVPEPASLTLAAVGALAFLPRRHAKRN